MQRTPQPQETSTEKNNLEEMNRLSYFWFIFVKTKDLRNFLFTLDKGLYKFKP